MQGAAMDGGWSRSGHVEDVFLADSRDLRHRPRIVYRKRHERRRGLSSLIAIVEVDTFAMALVFACLFGYVPDAVAFDTKKPGRHSGTLSFCARSQFGRLS